MFNSYTYGSLRLEDIPEKLLVFYNAHKKFDCPFQIIVGTDSQNTYQTKIVNVVCIVCEGHGGVFFYQTIYHRLINDVRTKLQMETYDSLDITSNLVELLEKDNRYTEMYLNCPVIIHVDAGNSPKGKTKALIPELVGWVNASGYAARTKPESFVASTIADRLSK